METAALARACGKSNVHNLEPNDLVALTVEAAAMAQVPLAGTDWIPGRRTNSDGAKTAASGGLPNALSVVPSAYAVK